MPGCRSNLRESDWELSMAKRAGLAAAFALLCTLLSACALHADENPQTFAYVDEKHIITAEVDSENTFVVNFINLSDYVIVIQPADFIYKGKSGQHYIGQVYELKHQDSLGNLQKYSASILVRGRSFEGLNIVGLFLERDAIEELSVRAGSRRFFLQGLQKPAFEELVKKIENIDLYRDDVEGMLQDLNIRAMGHTKDTEGTAEWDKDWEGLLTEDGINPPRVIQHPPIYYPADASRHKDEGTVRLSCVVTKNGGILNLKVIKGLDRKLDERAMDGVANSWLFVPATKNGEVFESLMEFNVRFEDPPASP